MAFAFGIQYGIEDIARANAQINRELDQQLQTMRQIQAAGGGMSGASGPFVNSSLGGGYVGDSTKADRDFDKKLQTSVERESRKIEARIGRSMRNLQDVSSLLRGQVGIQSVTGIAELGRDIAAGAVGGSGVVGRVAAGAVGVLGGVAAGLAKAAPPVAAAYAISSVSNYLFGNPVDKFMEKMEAYTRRGTGEKVDAQLKRFGLRTDRARIDLMYADPGDTGFDRASRLMEDAESYDTAANALLDGDPQRVAQSLKLPGLVTRATIAKHVSRLLATDPRALRTVALDMANRARQRQVREKAQADYFDANPEAASQWQARQREMKRQDELRAKSLRDWSRA